MKCMQQKVNEIQIQQILKIEQEIQHDFYTN